jgi:hypothetical protein
MSEHRILLFAAVSQYQKTNDIIIGTRIRAARSRPKQADEVQIEPLIRWT